MESVNNNSNDQLGEKPYHVNHLCLKFLSGNNGVPLILMCYSDHTGEKPYCCNGVSFNHIVLMCCSDHSGEKPYCCNGIQMCHGDQCVEKPYSKGEKSYVINGKSYINNG